MQVSGLDSRDRGGQADRQIEVLRYRPDQSFSSPVLLDLEVSFDRRLVNVIVLELILVLDIHSGCDRLGLTTMCIVEHEVE